MRRFWTADEDETVRLNYANHPTFLIAHLLNRSARAVYMRADAMGLKKSAEYLATQAYRFNGQEERSVASRFKAGHESWNKGRKGYQAGGRSVETRFKKGEMRGAAQHNYVPVGTLKVRDGLLCRKMTDEGYPASRWLPVHRLVWEAVNGPVPAGHIAVFKPGKATTHETDITADRVEVVTRAENMRRNSYLTRYPKEVADLIRLRGALNRKINRRTKGEKQAQ